MFSKISISPLKHIFHGPYEITPFQPFQATVNDYSLGSFKNDTKRTWINLMIEFSLFTKSKSYSQLIIDDTVQNFGYYNTDPAVKSLIIPKNIKLDFGCVAFSLSEITDGKPSGLYSLDCLQPNIEYYIVINDILEPASGILFANDKIASYKFDTLTEIANLPIEIGIYNTKSERVLYQFHTQFNFDNL